MKTKNVCLSKERFHKKATSHTPLHKIAYKKASCNNGGLYLANMIPCYVEEVKVTENE